MSMYFFFTHFGATLSPIGDSKRGILICLTTASIDMESAGSIRTFFLLLRKTIRRQERHQGKALTPAQPSLRGTTPLHWQKRRDLPIAEEPFWFARENTRKCSLWIHRLDWLMMLRRRPFIYPTHCFYWSEDITYRERE